MTKREREYQKSNKSRRQWKQFGEEIINLSDEELQQKVKRIRERLGMRTDTCPHCGGTGYDSYPNHATAYPTCPHCN